MWVAILRFSISGQCGAIALSNRIGRPRPDLVDKASIFPTLFLCLYLNVSMRDEKQRIRMELIEQKFTIWNYLLPTFLFGLSLYIGVVPKAKIKPSKNKIKLAGIGIALGIYGFLKIMLISKGEMNYYENKICTFSILIIGWSIYFYNTRPSRLTKGKKIMKGIIYFFISDFWSVSCTTENNSFYLLFCVLIIILMIIATYMGCLENKKHISNLAFYSNK